MKNREKIVILIFMCLMFALLLVDVSFSLSSKVKIIEKQDEIITNMKIRIDSLEVQVGKVEELSRNISIHNLLFG